MRDPNKYSLEQLLTSDSQLVVPEYQRGYDWKGDSQVKDLFMDLFSCIESDHNRDLFLGTMIFDVSKEADYQFEVIDGQQRLTTLLVVLLACRHYAAKDLGDHGLKHYIQNFIGKNDPLLGEQRNQLVASSTVRDVFERICGIEWDGDFLDQITVGGKQKPVKRQNARLKPIFDYSYNEIKQFCANSPKPNLQEILRQFLKRTHIIRIDIEDRTEAFEIFERTNARGKSLEIADLLKNFLFSKQHELSDVDIQEGWDEVTRNAGNSILRMLKYFWITRMGHSSSGDLYRNIRIYATENGIAVFFEELLAFSEFYAAFNSSDRKSFEDWLVARGVTNNKMYLEEASRAIGSLRQFRVTQTIPIVYSAVKSFGVEEPEARKPKKLLSLLRLLESFHFVNNTICNRVGNEIEKLYADYSKRFYSSPFPVTFDGFQKEMLDRIAGKQELVANFSRVSYDNPIDRPIIRYIFDRLLNEGTKPGQSQPFFDYFAQINSITSVYDIEHLQSQSLASDEDESVHEVGNLILLPKQINGILGNDDFSTKMQKLNDPSKFDNNIKHVPDYVKEFINEYGALDLWDRSQIETRTTKLAEETYRVAVEGFRYK